MNLKQILSCASMNELGRQDLLSNEPATLGCSGFAAFISLAFWRCHRF